MRALDFKDAKTWHSVFAIALFVLTVSQNSAGGASTRLKSDIYFWQTEVVDGGIISA